MKDDILIWVIEMLQIKVIDCEHEDDLTEAVNDYLSEIEEENVVSVQYSTSHFSVLNEQIFSFSACILVRIKD